MIRVDISNIWGQVSLPNLLALEKEVAQAHSALTEPQEEDDGGRGWLQPRLPEEELVRLLAAADRIRKNSHVFVVAGVGAGVLGAAAAIEALKGADHNLDNDGLTILFAGNSLSTVQWNRLCRRLEGKDFSIAFISRSGTTLEPALCARGLRWLLERRYGTDEARRRIYAVTDPVKGALRELAEREGWETFSIPADICGRYSVLTAAGLLPMAAAGLDIRALLSGADNAAQLYDLRGFDNPVWLYAAVRNLMYRREKAVELLESFEPDLHAFGKWWQALFAETEGKDGKGLLPVCCELTTDLHAIGQMIQQGRRNLFETMVRFAPAGNDYILAPDHDNPDGLNYLSGQTLAEVDEAAFQACVEAHMDGGVPVITMECEALNEQTLGELFYFFMLSCAISAEILGVNPFNQPGVQTYKRAMYKLLGRPGYDRL